MRTLIALGAVLFPALALAGPPAPALSLSAPNNVLLDQPFDLCVTNAPANARVYILASSNTDEPLVCAPGSAVDCTDLGGPINVLAVLTTDATGAVTLPVTLPLSFPLLEGHVQAVVRQPGIFETSNVATLNFYNPFDDLDGDGIDNLAEMTTFDTDWLSEDTDGDGRSDFDEIFTDNTDPKSGE